MGKAISEMKKIGKTFSSKIPAFSEWIFLLSTLLLMFILVSGCGKVTVKEENTEPLEEGALLTEEVSTKNEIAEEFLDLDPTLLENVVEVDDLTKEILNGMSLDQFRAFVCKRIPNYRAVFIIDSDKVMEEEDWLSLKRLVSYNLFGTLWYEPVEEFHFEMSEEEKADLLMEANLELQGVSANDLSEASTYLDSVTNEELLALLVSFFETNGYDTEVLLSMSEEELNVLREEIGNRLVEFENALQ